MSVKERIRPLGVSCLVIGMLATLLFLAMPQMPIFAGLRGHGKGGSVNWDRSGLDGRGSRNNIYDSNYKELAISYELVSVYAKPLEISDADKTAEIVSRVLLRGKKELMRELRGGQSIVWLGRRMPREQAEQIAQFNMAGIYFVEESRRYYPNHQTGAHVLGFSKEGRGLSGVELFYDDLLGRPAEGGQEGGESGLQWGRQSEGHLVLSLDLRIQSLLERRLLEMVEKSGASEAVGLIMDPQNGAVLGMMSYPAYDPNRFWEFDAANRQNRAMKTPVYLGGMAAVFSNIAAGTPEPVEKVVDEGGATEGESTAQGAVEEKPVILRPGMDHLKAAGASVGQLDSLARQLGLLDSAGIDLPSEDMLTAESGPARMELSLSDPFAVTNAVVMASAFSRLANGGKAIVPHLLSEVWDNKGKNGIVPEFTSSARQADPEFGKRFASLLEMLPGQKHSGDTVMLESFVDLGYLKSRDYDVQTESTETPPQKRFQHVLMGYSPVTEPDVLLVVVLNDSMTDPASSSNFRASSEALVQQVQRLATAGLPKPSSPIAATLLGVKPPAGGQDNDKEEAMMTDSVHHSERMPDVRGYSLRKAFQVLHGHGIAIKADGSGQVVAQKPAAGASLKGVQECTLRLDYGVSKK